MALLQYGSAQSGKQWLGMDQERNLAMGLSCSSKARKAFQVGFDVIRLAFEENDRWLCRELARDLG